MGKTRNKLSLVLSVLILLTLLSVYLLCGTMYARYVTSDGDEDSARVAVWDVYALREVPEEVKIVAGEEAGGGYWATEGDWYTFTVGMKEDSEVIAKYGVVVTLTKGNVSTWPSGVTAKLMQGNTLIAENTTGVFEDLGTFGMGEATEKTYTLCIKADTSVPGGTYKVSIAATVEQMDIAPND